MKVSIVIPNYNGEALLKKNLPNILESECDEVIVLDDYSKDKSIEVLEKLKSQNTRLAKQVNLKILIHKKNKGFIPSVNELFETASGDIVVLLNNDVFVEKDFIKPLHKHFENPKTFAVNLHEKGEGPSNAFWKNGFFEFKRGEEKNVVQKSSWASGGSAAYRKSIWQNLGGFDKLFAPFYWEDTDISFRAIKKRFEILWEPDSRVYHEHETTIKKLNRRYVKWVQERNQLLFIWKNITDSELKKEHKIGLLKRLFTKGSGYWIPFFWALINVILNGVKRSDESLTNVRNHMDNIPDMEAINYANT